jgi:hypothetical protein
MPVKSFLSFAGFVMLLAATYCPLLRPFGLTNLDLYDLNRPFGMVVLLVGVVGILGVVLKQLSLARFCAWVSLALVCILLVAALLKIHSTFSFIPFHSIAGFLARQIKFKWGWYLLFAGPVLAIAGISQPKEFIKRKDGLA